MHKTTVRQTYDRGIELAGQAGCFDSLFFDERDEVTEGGRSNLFACLDGVWVTPPLASGVLPGVARAALMRSDLHPVQRRLTRRALESAERLIVCSAVRGSLAARLRRDG
jgi:para-aminobenzoate synthetase/4-amino-4-deoxychorismate lyase